MKKIENKEEIVKNLVATSSGRDELHQKYKKKMEEILLEIIIEFHDSSLNFKKITLQQVKDFAHDFVERGLKPRD
jgi:hypothetical protein